MAKPYIEESGNGLHIHMSLLDKDGHNIFSDGEPTDNANMRMAVAGLLDVADSIQALACPTVNSFRRLAPESFAPTMKCWGYDNRTVAMRIPSGSRSAARIENRMAGADANPYLAVTAMLMGIYEGLTNKMTPPDPAVDNAYDQDHPKVADNQRDALRKMSADPRIVDWFGERFIDVYSKVKWFEVYLFEQQITQMEYDILLPYS